MYHKGFWIDRPRDREPGCTRRFGDRDSLERSQLFRQPIMLHLVVTTETAPKQLLQHGHSVR
jgi:hypothetical protein